jgi:hypothetical protein
MKIKQGDIKISGKIPDTTEGTAWCYSILLPHLAASTATTTIQASTLQG